MLFSVEADLKSPSTLVSKIGLALGVSNRARFARAIDADRRHAPQDYALADRLVSTFHAQGGLKQYTQSYKLVSLERLLRRERPARVLELGTGLTSVVLAKYAIETGAEITFVDEDRRWLRNTQANIERFIGHVAASFEHSPSRILRDQEPPCVRYSFEIATVYDLILVDGPALFIDGISRADGISADVLDLPPALLPSVIVVDMRAPTVRAMQEVLNETHEASLSDVLKRNHHGKFQYFSIFRRRS